MFGIEDRNGNAVNTGLFELKFGNNGFHGAVGMGGTDLNIGKLYQAYRRFEASARISQFLFGGEAGNAALETIAMLENTRNNKINYRLAQLMFDKKIGMELGSGTSGEGVDYNGMYDPDNPDTITISQELLGNMTQEDYAKIASVVSANRHLQ
ncbi:MAG: hypothetical protein SVR04_15135 [Spirochaetota bacterium]|nr:hypothetical protein [Spirochaetota bacterium]